jgi:hypothetical protein
MIRNYILAITSLMIVFEIQGMGNTPQEIFQMNNSPVFIKKVTNNSQQIVNMLKSHFFGYIAEPQKEPIATLIPQETKEWQPLLPMPFTSIHFLAKFHAVTIMAQGGYQNEDKTAYNSCLLTYFTDQGMERKTLLKDHSYTVEIVLGDRTRDGQVQFDKVYITEIRL